MQVAAHAVPKSEVAEAAPQTAAASADRSSVAWLQRQAGNDATARALGVQRCAGREGCRCEGDEEELRRGAGTLARAVLARKSTAVGGQCAPERTITGTVFHPTAEKETAVANKIVAGSTAALTRQNIKLELQLKPFIELFETDLTTNRGEPNEERMIRTEAHLCQLMGELETRRTKAGVVVLVAPFGGEICNGGAIACYMPNLGKHCGTLKNIKRLIVVDTFAPEDELGEVLAHEIGHHADWPQYRHPTEKGNYLNFGKNRDHYSPDVLQNMCSKDMQF
jgi:hypothetical protein